MLIDCDTCTVRGQGCDDCVVTVLLGPPPDWRVGDPTVVPLSRRGTGDGVRPGATEGALASVAAASGLEARAGRCYRQQAAGDTPEAVRSRRDVRHIDTGPDAGRSVVELDDVERRAVRALAEFGLVPPLRHQDASPAGNRHVS